jgi:hypothetical protein
MPRVGIDLVGDPDSLLRALNGAVAGAERLKINMKELSVSVAQSTNAQLQAAAKREARMKLEVEAWHRVARAAKVGSQEQVIATRRAAEAQNRLQRELGETTAAEMRTAHAARTMERDMSKFARGAATGFGLGGMLKGLAFTSLGFAGTAGITHEIRQSIEAAQESQVVQGQLQQAVKATGQSYAAIREQVTGYLHSTERLGFTEELAARGFTLLFRGSRNAATAYRELGLAADISRGRNVGLQQAANAVARAYGGQTGALRRLVPFIEKGATAQEAIRQAQQAFAGAAERYAHSAAGAQDRLSVAIHRTRITIGNELLPTVTRIADKMSAWLDKDKNQRRVQEDVRQAVHDTKEVLRALYDLIQLVTPAVKLLTTAFGGLHNTVVSLGIALAALKFAGLLGGIGGISGKAAGASGALQVLSGRIGTLAKLGAAGIAIDIIISAHTTEHGLHRYSGLQGWMNLWKDIKSIPGRLVNTVAGRGAAGGPAGTLGFEDVFTQIQMGQLSLRQILAIPKSQWRSDADRNAAVSLARDAAKTKGHDLPLGFGPMVTPTVAAIGEAGLSRLRRAQLDLAAAQRTKTTTDDMRALRTMHELYTKAIATETQRLQQATTQKEAKKFADALQALYDADASAMGQIQQVEDDAAKKEKDASDKEKKRREARKAALRAFTATRIKELHDLKEFIREQDQKRREIRKQWEQHQRERQQREQFVALGLTAGGEERLPKVWALRKQLDQLKNAMTGTILDTDQNTHLLTMANKVLNGAFGKITDDSKRAIQKLIETWTSQLGDTNIHKTVASAAGLTAGLGLTKAARQVLEARYAQALSHGGFMPAATSYQGVVPAAGAERKAGGGIVGGSGAGDVVPAMLTPGELVLNQRQIAGLSRKMGIGGGAHGLYAAARFAEGGVVPRLKRMAGTAELLGPSIFMHNQDQMRWLFGPHRFDERAAMWLWQNRRKVGHYLSGEQGDAALKRAGKWLLRHFQGGGVVVDEEHVSSLDVDSMMQEVNEWQNVPRRYQRIPAEELPRIPGEEPGGMGRTGAEYYIHMRRVMAKGALGDAAHFGHTLLAARDEHGKLKGVLSVDESHPYDDNWSVGYAAAEGGAGLALFKEVLERAAHAGAGLIWSGVDTSIPLYDRMVRQSRHGQTHGGQGPFGDYMLDPDEVAALARDPRALTSTALPEILRGGGKTGGGFTIGGASVSRAGGGFTVLPGILKGSHPGFTPGAVLGGPKIAIQADLSGLSGQKTMGFHELNQIFHGNLSGVLGAWTWIAANVGALEYIRRRGKGGGKSASVEKALLRGLRSGMKLQGGGVVVRDIGVPHREIANRLVQEIIDWGGKDIPRRYRDAKQYFSTQRENMALSAVNHAARGRGSLLVARDRHGELQGVLSYGDSPHQPGIDGSFAGARGGAGLALFRKLLEIAAHRGKGISWEGLDTSNPLYRRLTRQSEFAQMEDPGYDVFDLNPHEVRQMLVNPRALRASIADWINRGGAAGGGFTKGGASSRLPGFTIGGLGGGRAGGGFTIGGLGGGRAGGGFSPGGVGSGPKVAIAADLSGLSGAKMARPRGTAPLSRAFRKPPKPLNLSAGRGGAGGFTGLGIPPSTMGDVVEAIAARYTGGVILHEAGGGTRGQSPTDLLVPHWRKLFEVKGVSQASAKYQISMKPDEIRRKLEHARELGFDPAMMMVVLGQNRRAMLYWKPGLPPPERPSEGGRLSEQLGWQYLGRTRYAHGGVVGRDTVRAILSPGELVLNADQQRILARSTTGGDGGGITINGDISLPGVRDARGFVRELQKMSRQRSIQSSGIHAGKSLIDG